MAKTFSIVDGDISDGSHTFDELYEHRYRLWIALCKKLNEDCPHVWRSKRNADGTEYEGYFLLGYRQMMGKQISYHLPERLWNSCNFAETAKIAPEFDGHTADDVLSRLEDL